MTIQSLTAKVKARNRANTIALEWAPKLLALFTPFVGQKVMKATGGFTKKFSDVLPEFPCNGFTHVYIDAGHGYNIKATFKISEMQDANTCVYAEAVVYLAELRDGVLTCITNTPNGRDFRTDYTVAEIQSLDKEIRDAESALSSLRSKMGTFS